MNTKKERMYKRIEQHGKNLIDLFNPNEKDPIKLCKGLLKEENKLNRLAVDYCNGVINDEQLDSLSDKPLMRVFKLLSNKHPILFNRDPRGYALKVEVSNDTKIYRDMGGYGILAPDLTND